MSDNTSASGSSGPRLTTVVELSDILFTRQGNTIIDSVDLTINQGEHWAILGPNGSGKTTLINIITGYLWPTDGTVTVLGDLYGTVDIREKRRHIGLVSSALLERVPPRESFLNVVLSGRFASLGLYEDVHDQEIERANEIAGFLGCAGIKDRRYGHLSFGERQRALIGRALMAEPRLLIVDEPCEGLDIHARETVLSILESITSSRGPTLIMVTHRVEEIPPGISHTMILKDGCVLASGEKLSTLTTENLSRAMDVTVELLLRNGRIFAVVG